MARHAIVEFAGYGDIDEIEITNDMMEEDIYAAIDDCLLEFAQSMVSWRIEEDEDEE